MINSSKYVIINLEKGLTFVHFKWMISKNRLFLVEQILSPRMPFDIITKDLVIFYFKQLYHFPARHEQWMHFMTSWRYLRIYLNCNEWLNFIGHDSYTDGWFWVEMNDREYDAAHDTNRYLSKLARSQVRVKFDLKQS